MACNRIVLSVIPPGHDSLDVNPVHPFYVRFTTLDCNRIHSLEDVALSFGPKYFNFVLSRLHLDCQYSRLAWSSWFGSGYTFGLHFKFEYAFK